MNKKKRPLCFVLMPFKVNLKQVYLKAIKPACKEAGFDCLRMDEEERKGVYNINRKIIEHIFRSDVIVADLTDKNPNVFYEMGVAHAIDNKTIMIIQKRRKKPFDISSYNCIEYEQDEKGLEYLKNRIIELLNCMSAWSKKSNNPVQDFKPKGAYITPVEVKKLREQIREKERILKGSIYGAEADSMKKELESSYKDINALKKRLDEKDHQIKVLRYEADKKQDGVKRIAAPEGMIHIPKGDFIMGTSEEKVKQYMREHPEWSQEWFKDEKPEHKVWLDDYFICRYPVTNAQFAKFLNEYGKEKDETGHFIIDEHEWGVRREKNAWKPQDGFENHPVIHVTWYGANQYAAWSKCRLPTEAEWEKAAKGGRQFEYATDDGTLSPELANCMNRIGKTTPVGKYLPNPFGLYDMTGNVWEWCNDWYKEDYYRNSPDKNPPGPEKAEFRVVRGGSWCSSHENNFRCANRDRYNPDDRSDDLGFRVARSL